MCARRYMLTLHRCPACTRRYIEMLDKHDRVAEKRQLACLCSWLLQKLPDSIKAQGYKGHVSVAITKAIRPIRDLLAVLG